MTLDDWRTAGFGFVWVFGAALVLAAAGMVDYERTQLGLRFREVWARPTYQVVVNLGLCLFGIGFAGLSATVWELALWSLIALGFAAFTIQAWLKRRA